MRFEFATAGRIVFGSGTVLEAAAAAGQFGNRAFVVTGRNSERARVLLDALERDGVNYRLFSVAGEPGIEDIRTGIEKLQAWQPDAILGMGGGSAIDAGKAIAALATNPGDVMDYLEVIGAGKPLAVAPLPYIAIPTTSGTGAEVTRNAVLASHPHRMKASLRSPLMLPRLAVVDPDLTRDIPFAVRASTGLDALTQLIEACVSNRANPLTGALCREGLVRASRSLRRVCESPEDAGARADMALASLFSGLALANAGLGAVHGFAAPIGGMFAAPHGAICAALLPAVMEVNLCALRRLGPNEAPVMHYDQIARLLTGHPQARAGDALVWIKETCAALKVRPLRALGVGKAAFQELSEKAGRASSMKGNPVTLTAEERIEILEKAL